MPNNWFKSFASLTGTPAYRGRPLTYTLGVMSHRVRRLLGLAVLLSALAAPGWYLLRESRAASTYQQAALDQSESQIVAALGEPDEVLPCGEYLWWNGDQANPSQNDGRCVKWTRYNFFLHAFAFGYSAEGKLVSRYEYFSE